MDLSGAFPSTANEQPRAERLADIGIDRGWQLESEYEDEQWHAAGDATPLAPTEATEAIRKQMAKAGREDLYYLCMAILGYSALTPGAHMHLCRFIESCGYLRRMIHMPRGHLKTTIFTIARTIQDIINNPELRILIVASTEGNASRFLMEIRKHFESNELFRWLYPEVVPGNYKDGRRWNSFEIEVNRKSQWREPTVDAIGAGGNVESRHYDIIRADDLIGRREYNSETEMTKVIEWTDGLEALLVHPGCQIDFIGSKWKMSDVYAYVERFYSHDEPSVPLGPYAHSRGEIAVFTRKDIEDGRPIFEIDGTGRERFTLKYLQRLQARSPEFYAAQYANNPIAPGLATFREEWWRVARREGNEIVCYNGDQVVHRVWLHQLRKAVLFDPAVARNKKTSCRNAMIVVGWQDLGKAGKYIFVLESRVGHYSPTDAIDYIFELDKTWQPESFSIETVGYQGSIRNWLEDRAEREFLPYPPILEYTPGTEMAKTERIKGLQPFWRAGMIWVVGEHPELKEEFTFHPRGQFVDALDAFAQGPKLWGGVGDTGDEDDTLPDLDQTGYNLKRRNEADDDPFEGLDSSGYGRRPELKVA